MDVSHPLRGLLAPASAAALEVLCATTTPLTGREVHRLARAQVSLGAVQHAVAALVDLGLVTSTPAGRARLYVFNRDHVLAPAITEACAAGSALEAWLAARLAAWTAPPIAAWLFGSVARGEADVSSDVDLALIRPPDVSDDEWAEEIMTLAREVRARSGNSLDVLDLTAESLSDAVRRGDAIVDELRRDARSLLGPPPRKLLGPPPRELLGRVAS